MSGVTCWLESSLNRVFPGSQARKRDSIDLLVARGERISFQACIRNDSTMQVGAKATVSAADGLGVTIRRVGYVPMRHHNPDDAGEWDGIGHIPGLVPDPLFAEDSTIVGPLESQSFWINVSIPEDYQPGGYDIAVAFIVDDAPAAALTAHLEVRPITISRVRPFPVTHWFYADALCDWYKVEPYEERFWGIVEPYMRDMAEHGGSSQYVPLFTPPTDGVKRPHQLLEVATPSQGRYTFDFTDVRRWVTLARSSGASYFEWTHFFSQWGVKNALRIYRSNQDRDSLLWPPETEATSDTYRNFLAQFLPEFHDFLRAHRLLKCSIFHVSDEPHGDETLANYRRARALLKELAPWMKAWDALSDIRYAREGLTDFPIPSIAVAKQFAEEGFAAWAYFCCGPRGKYLNRVLDTPLAKIRMSGWLFYRLKALGFLHWGYNYWYKSQTQEMIDPFTESAGGMWPGWPYGDPFVVYPGPDGPLDSIRWEAFGESMQDIALLRTLNIDPDDALLAAINDYDDFPATEDWIASTRRQVLSAASC